MKESEIEYLDFRAFIIFCCIYWVFFLSLNKGEKTVSEKIQKLKYVPISI